MKISNVLKLGVLVSALTTSLLADSNSTDWGYTDHNAPQNWATLDPKYTMCKDGLNQSPINITSDVSVATKGLRPLIFDYKTTAASVVNNGHTIQVNIKDGSSISIDGIRFDLKQFHFHTPSENQINGKSFPFEAHFVHVSKDGQLAVIALMFIDGADNKIIKKIWKKMPYTSGKENAYELDAQSIKTMLPKNKAYYRFNGSLTTPPCSEGVRWFVLKNYSSVSKAQVEKFSDIVNGSNNRPIQAINARKVMK